MNTKHIFSLKKNSETASVELNAFQVCRTIICILMCASQYISSFEISENINTQCIRDRERVRRRSSDDPHAKRALERNSKEKRESGKK